MHSGVKPSAFAFDSLIKISAAPPSEIDDEFAAVMVPSFLNAARKLGIFSGRALAGCSSIETVTSPLRVLIV